MTSFPIPSAATTAPTEFVRVRALKSFVGSYVITDPENSDSVDEVIEFDASGFGQRKRLVYKKRYWGKIAVERRLTSIEKALIAEGNLPANVTPIKIDLGQSSHYHPQTLEVQMCVEHPPLEHAEPRVPVDVAVSLIARGLAEPASDDDARKIATHGKAAAA